MNANQSARPNAPSSTSIATTFSPSLNRHKRSLSPQKVEVQKCTQRDTGNRQPHPGLSG
jgi:hypothetical protein